MLHIRIKQGHKGGNLSAVVGDTTLFVFNYRRELNAWLFWIPGRSDLDPIVRKQRAFPWEYFEDLCRAVYFLYFDGPLYNSAGVDVVSGKSYVG